jgi:glutaredoxin
MNPMSFARSLLAAGLVGLSAMTLAVTASAQQVFRIVGPDGRVTFSDKPPVEPARAIAAPTVSVPGTSGPGLPFELRQVALKYPVTLYSGPDCGPCGAGRAFLSSRGIPFTEKTVTTNDDIGALQRLSGATSLPFMTVGGQQLKGYSEVEWGQFLDAAGYPKTSQLPASYRPAAATPLVAVQAPAPAAVPTPVAPAPTQAAAPGPAPSNPAGIRF